MNTQGWRLGTSTGFGLTGFRAAGVGVLVVAGFIACAGDDTPPVDNQTREDLAREYPDPEGQEAAAGSANSGGGAAGAAGSGGAVGGSSGRAGSSSGTTGGSGGGSPTGGGSGSGVPCDAFNTILQPRCGTAGCHGPNSSQGSFGVSEEGAADFVDQTGTFESNGCDQSYIDSADPEQSLIYLKLGEDFPLGCGNLQMPLNGSLLTEEEKDCVLSWLGQF
jgi:hypothetical protein